MDGQTDTSWLSFSHWAAHTEMHAQGCPLMG